MTLLRSRRGRLSGRKARVTRTLLSAQTSHGKRTSLSFPNWYRFSERSKINFRCSVRATVEIGSSLLVSTGTPLPPCRQESQTYGQFSDLVFEKQGLISKYFGIRTYGFAPSFLLLDPCFAPIGLSSPAWGIENVKERLLLNAGRLGPPLKAGTRFAATI